MKTILVLVATIIVIAVSLPVDEPKNAKLLRYESNQVGNDGYQYA